VFQLHHRPDEAAGPTFRIDGKRNLLRGRESLYRFEQTPIYLGQSHQRRLTVPQIQTLLARLMSWRTMGDLHVGGREGYLAASAFGQKYDFRRVGSSAQDWRRWWDFPAHEPSTAPPTLVGETLLARPGERLADIRPEDFRLKGWDGAASLSPGADVDVVGPGAAYERWKTTPAYAEWRRRSWDKTHGIQ
jgi:hypothetical protein